ncbi:PREDICTED: Parkinson disease 7 domain-containing protein 1 isoform X4 [Cercocebus atys]|uniref:Parkinson disease 7 domain-containing protein 1 isoform X4 n=1 Tax=Cercocebus atys TaxID=9531 RepID=UPI0005F55659|nr:PREDICTED: Parkinson disease 7 domain-containing protein 1 isoform X4 [Cercocebus atys]
MASERLSSRPACLLVASGAAEGVSAQSFFHCFTMASTAFNLQVATPGGKAMEFVDVTESNARWVQDFRLKAYASPAKLESIDGARYHALLIPSCPGALTDLASSGSLARILQHFHSESKPICAVGHGVAALCCATNEDRSWVFHGYSLTGQVSLTPCTLCWTATWSRARMPAPLSRPCRTCSSSVAAGNEPAG